ncbi:MAG TPA: hypothetical protein VLT36_21585 [Candidatus Dormibacteraeota bacterium]|nr:hypothetical protein [Candidatus Dormibacteraeota bacterium]
MSAKYTRVPTEFGPDTRFELKPAGPPPFRAAQETRFARLKSELILERLETDYEGRFGPAVKRAANEAAALAWVTPYPLLVFPVLFDEKAEGALARLDRQEEIRQRSRELLAV